MTIIAFTKVFVLTISTSSPEIMTRDTIDRHSKIAGLYLCVTAKGSEVGSRRVRVTALKKIKNGFPDLAVDGH